MKIYHLPDWITCHLPHHLKYVHVIHLTMQHISIIMASFINKWQTCYLNLERIIEISFDFI